MDVRIRTIGPIRVARIRHVVPYDEVGPCFDRLFRWASAIGVPTGRVLTLSWGDPEGVPGGRLRFDACVELRTNEDPPPGIELGTAGGGRYAVCRLVGPYEGIPEAYRRLLGDWLPGNNESAEDGPCIEVYLKTQGDTAPEELVTDLCVPLRERTTG